MSLILQINQSAPFIQSPSIVYAITGEKIILSGIEFKKGIIQISGENIYNSNDYFNAYGRRLEDVSGIDNTLYLDVVGFTIPTGVTKTKYDLSVFNLEGKSTNTVQLNILDQPSIVGIEKTGAFPDEFVRISGTNFYPAPNLFFIDSRNNKIIPTEQNTGLYKITGYELLNNGTGYNIGEKIYIDSTYHKLFDINSSGILEVQSTGISGSIAFLNIFDSGSFTIVPTGFILQSQTGNGRDANIILNYEKFEYTGFNQFIEFKIPRNVTKNQGIFVENLKYKAPIDLNINSISVSKTGFQVLGSPKIYNISPITGYNQEDYIRISGDNLTFVTGLNLGPLKNINFNYDGEDLVFQIPYLAENSKVNVITNFGEDSSDQILQILYRPLDPTGFSPNDILLSGGLVSISGKNLHRINYISLGQQNINREKITVNYLTGSTHQASFILPNNYITNEIYGYSLDYPNSGTKIVSPDTNDKLIASVRLNTDLINIRYLSGVQAAKYLDEVEIYSPIAYSGDYGNLTNSEIFFNTPTGKINVTGDYSVSGIKINNTPTGIKIKIPREIQNPRSQIKIKRNKFNDEYLLPANKSFDILPTISFNSPSNTNYNNLGEVIISGINATNVNQVFFSGNAGTKNIFGFKDVEKIKIDILEKNISGISSGIGPDYTYIRAKLGGDFQGTGKLFLFNNYYDTGIGYENSILSDAVSVSAIEGFRPPNSTIFTSPSYISSPIDEPFFYKIQTNSRATSFSISATTLSGVDDDAIFPPGINTSLNSSNQIFGTPSSGGIYYIKIRALDGDFPNEGMILNAAFGYSGRSLTGPGITYRGEWSTGIGYVGNNLRRDVVKYSFGGVNYWYAATTNIDSAPSGTSPDWIPFTNEFSATATQILLAERSNITSELNIGQAGIPSGFIKSANDIDSNEGSGFYLGYDNSYNAGLPKFRVGSSGGYIKFDGLGLDIFGPLSGVLTTSRNVRNTDNTVGSEYSLSVGFNNRIETGANNSIAIGSNNLIHENTPNSFIFGENNVVTGGRRIAISAGSRNVISGDKNYESLDSVIVGGVNNTLYGSYSNIVGGKNNFIDSVTSGYSAISNQLFDVPVTGTTGAGIQNINIEIPKPRSSANYAILNSQEYTESLTGANGSEIISGNFKKSGNFFIPLPNQFYFNLSGRRNFDYSVYYDNKLTYETGKYIGIASGTLTGIIDGFLIQRLVQDLRSTFPDVIEYNGLTVGTGLGSGFISARLSGTDYYGRRTGILTTLSSGNIYITGNLFPTGTFSSNVTRLNRFYVTDINSGVLTPGNTQIKDIYGGDRLLNNSGVSGALFNSNNFNTSRILSANNLQQFISGNGNMVIGYNLPYIDSATYRSDFINLEAEFVGYYNGANKGIGNYFYFYAPSGNPPTGRFGNSSGVGYVVDFNEKDGKVQIFWNTSLLTESAILPALSASSTSINSWPITGKIGFHTGVFNVLLNNQLVIDNYKDNDFLYRNKDSKGFGLGAYTGSGFGGNHAIRNFNFSVGLNPYNEDYDKPSKCVKIATAVPSPWFGGLFTEENYGGIDYSFGFNNTGIWYSGFTGEFEFKLNSKISDIRNSTLMFYWNAPKMNMLNTGSEHDLWWDYPKLWISGATGQNAQLWLQYQGNTSTNWLSNTPYISGYSPYGFNSLDFVQNNYSGIRPFQVNKWNKIRYEQTSAPIGDPNGYLSNFGNPFPGHNIRIYVNNILRISGITAAYTPFIDASNSGLNHHMGFRLFPNYNEYASLTNQREVFIKNFRFTGTSSTIVNDIVDNQDKPTGNLIYNAGEVFTTYPNRSRGYYLTEFGYDNFYKNDARVITGYSGIGSRFQFGPGQIQKPFSGIIDVNNLYTNSIINIGGVSVNNSFVIREQKTTRSRSYDSFYDDHKSHAKLKTNAKYIEIDLGSGSAIEAHLASGSIRKGFAEHFRKDFTISAWIYPQVQKTAWQPNAADVTGNISYLKTLIAFVQETGTGIIKMVNPEWTWGLYVGAIETSGHRTSLYPSDLWYNSNPGSMPERISLDTRPGVASDPYSNTGAFLFGSFDGMSRDTSRQSNYFYNIKPEVRYVSSHAIGRLVSTGASFRGESPAIFTGSSPSIYGPILSFNYLKTPTYGVLNEMRTVSNSWNHVAFSCNSYFNNDSFTYDYLLRYYINGKLVTSGLKNFSARAFGVGNPYGNFNKIYIGAMPVMTGGLSTSTSGNPLREIVANAFQGYIGELRVDDYAITGNNFNVEGFINDYRKPLLHVKPSGSDLYISDDSPVKLNKKHYYTNRVTGYANYIVNFNQDFITGRYYPPTTFGMSSWINSVSENVYSGTFALASGRNSIENNKRLQFKVLLNSLNTSTNTGINVNFVNKFNTGVVNNFNYIVLPSYIQTGNIYNNFSKTGFKINNFTSSGFRVRIDNTLSLDTTGMFFVAQTGAFRGIDGNSGKFIEINSLYLSGANNLTGDQFFNDYTGWIRIPRLLNVDYINYNKPRFFGNVYAQSGSDIIDSQYSYVYRIGEVSGAAQYRQYFYSPAAIIAFSSPDTYLPFSGGGMYSPPESNINLFDIITGGTGMPIPFYPTAYQIKILKDDYYNIEYAATFDKISGPDVSKSVSFRLQKSVNTGSNWFTVQEKIYTDSHIYSMHNTGIDYASSGDLYRVNVNVFYDPTGTNNEIYSSLISISRQEDFDNRRNIYVKLNNPNIDSYAINKNRMLTGLKIDYILTDEDIDYSTLRDLLGEGAFGRISLLGFEDVGSSSIFGGTGNYIKGLVNTIGGGINNSIIGDYNTIPGGRSNTIIDTPPGNLPPQALFSTILGGNFNTISGNVVDGVILGGETNLIMNSARETAEEITATSIIGGKNNVISGSYSTILGGFNNIVSGAFGYGLGRNVFNTKSGSMVLSDATSNQLKPSFNENSLTLFFTNGMYITGVDTGSNRAPIIFALNSLPTSSGLVPVGGLYRSGDFIKIRLS